MVPSTIGLTIRFKMAASLIQALFAGVSQPGLLNVTTNVIAESENHHPEVVPPRHQATAPTARKTRTKSIPKERFEGSGGADSIRLDRQEDERDSHPL
jgi:hypothetical protein